MAERSFRDQVEQLRIGEGAVFHGEGILAVTKALLQSGVAYVGGYQGAPISHLLDVFADATDLMHELGVHYEASANEATAAAMLAASVNYPLRGAVAWKSVVGTNVASDALSNLASGGVTGGALVIVGEDYGEGSSIVQERTHAFAMKSQIWLLDPRPDLALVVETIEKAFQLSEASHTPVMLQMRVRGCHQTGSFVCRDNRRPSMTVADAANNPVRDESRIVLPPASFHHEKEKIEERWPAAVRFIRDNCLNEHFGPASDEIGIIVQGGLFNTLNRSLELLGLSNLYGASEVPIYVLNVAYPLIPDEVASFCRGKKAVLILEEGQPEFIEHELNTLMRRHALDTAIVGKQVMPRAGEYTAAALDEGLRTFFSSWAPDRRITAPVSPTRELTAADVPARPPGLCTGCPERPIFTALKLVQQELGQHHVSADIGCHLFSILPPFHIGNTTMGYGLGAAGAAAFRPAGRKAIAIMGDGGFWHNGLTSGIGNAVFNRDDNVTIIVDNGYSAATGGQDNLSSQAENRHRQTKNPIEKAARGVGVNWVRAVTRTYDVTKMRDALREALTSTAVGPKLVLAQSECQLNRQRRVRPAMKRAIADGRRVVKERFGVDPDTCTGDHSCIRLSGCPSLTIKANPDPLRKDPVAHVDNSCVGCGVCGEISHAAILCPSFYKAEILINPTRWDRVRKRLSSRLVSTMQSGFARSLAKRAF
jgi:indolepyruvate ferredoxin oxidoreductase, alpha subunit